MRRRILSLARARARAEADRALREDSDGVADANRGALRRREACRKDVAAQDDVVVLQIVGDLREIGLRARDEHVLGLTAVDRVAEAPAADGLLAQRSSRSLKAPDSAG